MNKYKLTYENGKTETVLSKMKESEMKAHLMPKDGSYVQNKGRIVKNVELV